MVKSFDWFTTRTYADKFSNGKLLTSTLHNLYKESIIVPYMDVFLIDSWELNKRGKQIKFIRQALSVSEEMVPLELFYLTSCRLIEEICSTWVIIWDTLSGIVTPLEYFSQTTCHHIRGTCSTWKVFTDKRSEPLIENFFRCSRFSR